MFRMNIMFNENRIFKKQIHKWNNLLFILEITAVIWMYQQFLFFVLYLIFCKYGAWSKKYGLRISLFAFIHALPWFFYLKVLLVVVTISSNQICNHYFPNVTWSYRREVKISHIIRVCFITLYCPRTKFLGKYSSNLS